MNSEALQERLIDFGVRIIRVAEALPKNRVGNHLAGQTLRCGTSPAPNYGEACSAESREDFIHKLKVVLKELNETSVWLRMILKAELIKAPRLGDLIDENKQLCMIINKSITTSRSRLRRSSIPND
jgi:four helix bundle protein